jgi:cystathionine beta-lyase
MDFQAPTEVLDALQQAVAHGIFGYSEVKKDYFNILHDWFYGHFNWDIQESWLIKTPGVELRHPDDNESRTGPVPGE